jgi:Ca2+-binding EF-hand superfamily protein
VAYPPYTLVRLKKVFEAGDWSAPVVCLSKWKNVGNTKPRKGREIMHSKLAQLLRTKSTFGLPPHFTDAELEEGIGWRKDTRWGGYEECGPEALRVGLSRTALHQDDYIFVDPFYWQPDVKEMRPNCRLLLVRATFKFPANPQSAGKKATHKMCDEFASLTYGGRQTYIDGLNDILHKPILTMQQEWQRELCWSDREGVKYKSTEAWAYVTGPAIAADCTPGRRDATNNGKTPQDFMQEVNDEIRRHWLEEKKTQDVPAFALVTLDEVLSVRLYTGPGHQPINDFLRQIAKLSGRLRLALAKSASDTFTATVANICHAIRKLLAITPPSQMGTPLYRGVRGELPTTFWVQDEQNMVCAVEGGFMSTSKNKETPIKYMGMGHHNILWKIEAMDESDVAFHRGADVSRLSQFAAEEEVLFPPCTILQVVKLPDATSEAGGKGEATARERGAPTHRKYLDIVESNRFDSEKTSMLSALLQKETDNRVLQCFAENGGHWIGQGEARQYSFDGPPKWSEVSKSLRAAEMQFPVMAAARRLFQAADTDKSNTLDRGELESVVRDLARANQHYLTDANVTEVANRCIDNFGNGVTVDEAGFLKYVDSMPAMFGKLDLWKFVFSHYASGGNNGAEISKTDAYKLVRAILNSNDQNCEAEDVEMYTTELLKTADSDNSGSISFPEFVKYATDRQNMFEKLRNAIGTPQVETATMGGAAQQNAGDAPPGALRSASSARMDGRMTVRVSDGDMDEYTKFQMQKAKGLGLQVSFHQVSVSDSKDGDFGDASSVQKSFIQLDVTASFV